jgi:hypothetical protein
MAPPCPSCARSESTAIRNLSTDADLKYYRCDRCGHLWVVFRDGEIHHVTPLKDAAQP